MHRKSFPSRPSCFFFLFNKLPDLCPALPRCASSFGRRAGQFDDSWSHPHHNDVNLPVDRSQNRIVPLCFHLSSLRMSSVAAEVLRGRDIPILYRLTRRVMTGGTNHHLPTYNAVISRVRGCVQRDHHRLIYMAVRSKRSVVSWSRHDPTWRVLRRVYREIYQRSSNVPVKSCQSTFPQAALTPVNMSCFLTAASSSQ